MTDITRRAVLGAAGLGAAGTALSWKRLTGLDIPGRGADQLNIAINGTAQDAAANQGLIDAFSALHPDIKVRIVPIQGADWSDFFAKILTLVAAGTPPDVVMVATEGTQLFAERLAHPLDEFVMRDKEEMREFFEDVHPSLIEAFMYQGNLFQLPFELECRQHVLLVQGHGAGRAGLSPRGLDLGRLPGTPAPDAQGVDGNLPALLLDQSPVGWRGAVALQQ